MNFEKKGKKIRQIGADLNSGPLGYGRSTLPQSYRCYDMNVLKIELLRLTFLHLTLSGYVNKGHRVIYNPSFFFLLLKNRVHFWTRSKQGILLPFANPATGHTNPNKYEKYHSQVFFPCTGKPRTEIEIIFAFTVIEMVSILTSAATFQIILPCPFTLQIWIDKTYEDAKELWWAQYQQYIKEVLR